MTPPVLKSVFETSLSTGLVEDSGLTKQNLLQLFDYFNSSPLFKWHSGNNDCEDRANAICILLDAWSVPNYKGWVFQGSYLNRNHGTLINMWNYHVGAVVGIKENEMVVPYVIDPSLLCQPESLETWAGAATDSSGSGHFITNGQHYIFKSNLLKADTWHLRNRQNFKWTIQGLAGINGVSQPGKAQLCFCKNKIAAVGKALKKLMNTKPAFLECTDFRIT